MIRHRGIQFGFLILSILPLSCAAQSKKPFADAPTISVRDLTVPDAARRDFNEGTRLLELKEWGASVSKFRLAIANFPAFYEAYYRLGIAEAKLRREPEAESSFRKSIELSGGHYAPPYFGLGLILCDQNKRSEAEALVQTGLDIDPADAAGYFALAWILYSTDRLADAEATVRQAISRQPDLLPAHRLLAQIQLRQDDQSAVVDLDTYSSSAPDGPGRLPQQRP